jgi:hypothetical protein
VGAATSSPAATPRRWTSCATCGLARVRGGGVLSLTRGGLAQWSRTQAECAHGSPPLGKMTTASFRGSERSLGALADRLALLLGHELPVAAVEPGVDCRALRLEPEAAFALALGGNPQIGNELRRRQRRRGAPFNELQVGSADACVGDALQVSIVGSDPAADPLTAGFLLRRLQGKGKTRPIPFIPSCEAAACGVLMSGAK